MPLVNGPGYDDVFDQQAGNPVVREVCTNEDSFANVLADALKGHAASPPADTPNLTNALQGNLSEFGVWDMGERYWSLFERRMTWPANADSPWKASSSDGVDILALAGSDDKLILLVVEVKSSGGHGANLVTGGNSSLQSDFDRLFEGPVQDRLPISVGRVLTSLRLVHHRTDLEEQVKGMVGISPMQCASVRLLGVLVCNQGTASDGQTRDRAFNRLASHLASEGWNTSQISFRTIETSDLAALLDDVIHKATE